MRKREGEERERERERERRDNDFERLSFVLFSFLSFSSSFLYSIRFYGTIFKVNELLEFVLAQFTNSDIFIAFLLEPSL